MKKGMQKFHFSLKACCLFGSLKTFLIFYFITVLEFYNYYKTSVFNMKNICPIMMEPITLEESYLVWVPKGEPKKDGDKPQDKYYYIGNYETLMNCKVCPLTRREGMFYIIKLSTLDSEKLKSLLIDEDTLIESNDTLSKIDTASWNWEVKQFNQPLVFANPYTIFHHPNQINQVLELLEISNEEQRTAFVQMIVRGYARSGFSELTTASQGRANDDSSQFRCGII